MKSALSAERSWHGRHLKITLLNPIERDAKIHDAIAQRSFQICKKRNCAPGHQLEDWRRAESETLHLLNCGYLVLDDKIALSTDAACFEEGEIEICLEPRRLTICGRQRGRKQGVLTQKATSSLNGNLIFRALDLPVQIEPSEVTARFKGRSLEIDLPKALGMHKAATEKTPVQQTIGTGEPFSSRAVSDLSLGIISRKSSRENETSAG